MPLKNIWHHNIILSFACSVKYIWLDFLKLRSTACEKYYISLPVNTNMTVGETLKFNGIVEEKYIQASFRSRCSTAEVPVEFSMPADEAFLLVEIYIADKVPLWVSPEEISGCVGISREQAMAELRHFYKVYRVHSEWKIASNGQIFLKVLPSFLEHVESSTTLRRSFHSIGDNSWKPQKPRAPAPIPIAESFCRCGHGKGNHDFDDGGHCRHCNCSNYRKRGSN